MGSAEIGNVLKRVMVPEVLSTWTSCLSISIAAATSFLDRNCIRKVLMRPDHFCANVVLYALNKSRCVLSRISFGTRVSQSLMFVFVIVSALFLKFHRSQ